MPPISPAPCRGSMAVSPALANAADGSVSNADKSLQQAQMIGLVYK
jgi:hypothetical protein